MKTFMILVLASFFNNVLAQESPKTIHAKAKQTNQNVTDKEFVMMRDKKVWIVRNGRDSLLTNVLNIGGVKVSADGSITLKDGSSTLLKEGDKVTSNGVIVRAAEEVPEQK